MTTRRNFIKQLGLATAGILVGCSTDEEGKGSNSSGIDVDFKVPSYIDVVKGGSYSFTVNDGKNPLLSDYLMLTSSTGVNYICEITTTSSTQFTVQIPSALTSGDYNITLRRDDRRKEFGSTYFNVAESSSSINLNDDTTVYGVVSSSEGPVSGVIVSDGVLVTVTDKDGVYQLASEKEQGYVFISVPSGYEVSSNGVQPQYYYLLKASADITERWDFTLTPKSGQEKFKMFMLGDMHMTSDMKGLLQYGCFTDDLNEYMAEHAGETMYAISLGDMTWDVYWYNNYSFSFPEYLDTVNQAFLNLQIFPVMGNHDNDYKAYNDFDAEKAYVQNMGPTYYSFNIGKIHFVVLDDIDCTNYDGTTARSYTCNITQKQLDWLKKDLAYVDTGTPLILCTHAQIFWPSSSSGFVYDSASSRTTNTNALLSVIGDYNTHILTGHTHEIFNVTPGDSVVAGRNLYEHNSGSICCTWWRSDYYTPGIHVSPDGSPGGYGIWDIDGTDIKFKYKAFGFDEDYQFRTYDLNNVHFSLADVPNMNSSNSTLLSAWNKYVNAYPENSNNEVLINIWNWNRYWTLKVVDDSGKEYTPSEVWAYDPLHILGYSAVMFNDSTISSEPANTTSNFCHFFKVKVNDSNSNLTITATDEFGNSYTQYMERPKEFSIEAYMNPKLSV